MRTANAVDSTLSSLDPFEVVWFRKRYFIVTFYRDKQEKKAIDASRFIAKHSKIRVICYASDHIRVDRSSLSFCCIQMNYNTNTNNTQRR